MAIHANGASLSPYPRATSLADLVPPDHRRRDAALFGLACAVMGALMAWSVKALVTWEPTPGGWFAFRGRALEAPDRVAMLAEPVPSIETFTTLTALVPSGAGGGSVRSEPVALGGRSLLTVICFPTCDDVTLDGASTGASPLWQHAIEPGAHRLGLRFGRRVMRFELHAAPDEATILKQPGYADEGP